MDPTQYIDDLCPVGYNPVNCCESEDDGSSYVSLQGEVITYMETPIAGDWCLVPIFRKTKSDGISVWQVSFCESDESLYIKHGTYITTTGKCGKLQLDQHSIVTNLSGRTLQEQALLEARERYNKKYHDHYKPIGDAGIVGVSPMLANTYSPPVKNNKTGKIKSNISTLHLTAGVSCQYKLDGVRALTSVTNNKVNIMSRTNKPFSWLEHIKAELIHLFMYLPPGAALDGEIYNHDIGFQKLISILQSKKRKHNDNCELNYYIFDIAIPDVDTISRMDMLALAVDKCREDGHTLQYCNLVASFMAHTHDDINAFLRYSIDEGKFEGLMIRKTIGNNTTLTQIKETYYKPRRSNNLLKVKDYIYEEAVVLDVKSASGKETDACILVLKDERGNTFTCRPTGTIKQRKRWFDNRNELVGKQYTYKYGKLTDAGKPCFPVGIAFRDYE